LGRSCNGGFGWGLLINGIILLIYCHLPSYGYQGDLTLSGHNATIPPSAIESKVAYHPFEIGPNLADDTIRLKRLTESPAPSSLEGVAQHLCCDVAARKDNPQLVGRKMMRGILNCCSQGRSAGTFSDVMGAPKQDRDGRRNFLITDRENFADPLVR
jgi:hypothetical protein